MSVQRWVIVDLSRGDGYEFHVNPNAGGSGVPEKTMNVEVMYSPETNGVLQQGPWGAPVIPFSGAILSQEQDEAMERWVMRETRLRLTDDLGRVIIGTISSFARTRTRRANNPWFSTYDAEITVLRMTSASGVMTWNPVEA